MEKKKIAGFCIMLLAVIVLIATFSNNIVELPEARFISAETNHPTFSPNEQIRVDYTYKNTWSSGYQFKIEGELDGGQYQYQKTGIISSLSTFSNTMYFTAPSTEGTYTIKLEGSIYYSGHWVDGDGKSTMTITVVDPHANLIISSNVPNVLITCSNGETYLIDDSKLVSIENLDLNTAYQFEATVDGYYSESFEIIPIIVDNTYALTLTEIPVIEDPVIEDPVINETPILIEEEIIVEEIETPTNEELIQDNEKITMEIIQNDEKKQPNIIIYIGLTTAIILLISGFYLMRK